MLLDTSPSLYTHSLLWGPTFAIKHPFIIRHWLNFSGQAFFTHTFPKNLREEHCVANWVMLVRETPLQLERNEKMSVKPCKICLVPYFFLFPLTHLPLLPGEASLPGPLFFHVQGCNDSLCGKFHRHNVNWWKTWFTFLNYNSELLKNALRCVYPPFMLSLMVAPAPSPASLCGTHLYSP